VNAAQPATLEIQSEKFESPYVTMWLEEGILCGRYANDLHLSLEVAKSCVEARIFFTKGKSYPLLVDMTGIKSTTKEARDYMASIGATLVTAGALITRSSVSKTIGNIFLTIDKPPVPVRMFTNEEKAREWLKQFL
jgi:hypothetical protein